MDFQLPGGWDEILQESRETRLVPVLRRVLQPCKPCRETSSMGCCSYLDPENSFASPTVLCGSKVLIWHKTPSILTVWAGGRLLTKDSVGCGAQAPSDQCSPISVLP